LERLAEPNITTHILLDKLKTLQWYRNTSVATRKLRIYVYFDYLGLVIGIAFYNVRVYVLFFFSVYYIALLLFAVYLHCKWSVGPYAF